MTTIGYVGIPFTVSITMHAAIHATHYVGLYANDARLTVGPSGTNMIFTPANWNVAQTVEVVGHAPGDLELLAHISNDYFVNGIGTRRFIDGLVDLSVTTLPLDTWTGSVPRWSDDSPGDLQIAHNNLVIGDKLRLSVANVSGLTFDTPFPFNGAAVFYIDLPDGSHTSVGPGDYTMALAGVYVVRASAPFAIIQAYDVGAGRVIRVQDFGLQATDATGTPRFATVYATGVKSQGYATAGGFSYDNGASPVGVAISGKLVPSGGYAETTYLGALSFRFSGTSFGETNCSGSTMASGAANISLGTTPSGSPGSGFAATAYTHNGFFPTIDGVDASSGAGEQLVVLHGTVA